MSTEPAPEPLRPLSAEQLREMVVEAQHRFGRVAKVPVPVWDAVLSIARAIRPIAIPSSVPDHPHDGYAYAGCVCVCCVNIRNALRAALASVTRSEPTLDAAPELRAALANAYAAYARSSEGAGSVQPPVVQRLIESVFDFLASSSVTPSEPTLDVLADVEAFMWGLLIGQDNLQAAMRERFAEARVAVQHER